MENTNKIINKQSSVEWQYSELMLINFQYATNRITPGYFQEQLEKIKEQAKAMHKEEIINSNWEASEDTERAEQYYNRTF